MFRLPGPPVHKRLFEAVPGAHHGDCRERLRLTRSEEENRSRDVTLALAHHARHHSRRLKPRKSLFGGPGVQTTVGVVDRYQSSIHDFWTHEGQRGKLREWIGERPGARGTVLERSIDPYHSLLSVVNSQMIWISSVRGHVVFEGRITS